MDNNIHNSQNDSEWKNNFSKLNDWESMPPLDGWDKISEQLDKPSRSKFLYWFIFLGFILFSSIGTYFIVSQNNISPSNFAFNTKKPKVQKEAKSISNIEKSNIHSNTKNSIIQSDINKNPKSNLSESPINNSISNSKKSISNKFSSSKTGTKSSNFSQKTVTQEKNSKNIISTTDLNNDKEDQQIVNINQENSQIKKEDKIATNQNNQEVKNNKKLLFALDKIALGEIKLNANPFFEMQIDSIKIASNNDKIDSLNKINSSLSKESNTISKWKIASYTGLGMTYKHFTANQNDNHYVRMQNEKQAFNERQSLTFGFMAERKLSKKWNLHTDIGILKWKNTIHYEFGKNYYSAPTEYTATKFSTTHVSIEPIYGERENVQTQTLNYESTYFKADLGMSYSLFQSKKWKHQIGVKTGLLLLTNESSNYDIYESTSLFPSAKKVIPFLAAFHQTHYQLNNHWGIFGESSFKYLPNSVGDKNTIWQIRFYQVNLHLGISYKF
ncbi:hypothetical protein Fleli_0819 [Bernardetia litoralis DSM 6794]|uniref:Outer membrane protein beta-barrel domain-containing protein n=1 Tax=Bernardetia litoralis (strain ATCC 23117 / DSM 6794 / NBRC 15988 / NCIMB 1366 / Fx l1 / Sio-4) TaxID=880071 RepID=I4AH42_BERLS|nr:hypothetical protein [Bernardetia litoralis]AFM03277.1 hypothetical protein Fleli_0819 [Bernardetia litoralis DSM 6794]